MSLDQVIDVRLSTSAPFATPTWGYDPSSAQDVRAVTVSRSGAAGQFGAGRYSVELRDHDADWDPAHPSCPFDADWTPVKAVVPGAVFYGIGGAANRYTTPHAAALNITGTITVVAWFLDFDSQPTDYARVLDKGWVGAYMMARRSAANGGLLGLHTYDGTSQRNIWFSGTNTYVRAGTWVKIESVVSGGNRVNTWFTKQAVGEPWVTREVSTSPTWTISTTASALAVGNYPTGSAGVPWTGRIGRVQVYNGTESGGTLVADWDPGRTPEFGSLTFTDSTGKVWTRTATGVSPRPWWFRGFVTPGGWKRSTYGPNGAITTLDIVDCAAIAQMFPLELGDIAREWSSERLRRVFNAAGAAAGAGSWPTAWADIDDVDTSFVCPAWDGTGNAWAHAQQIGLSEGGAVLVDRKGRVRLWGRHTAAERFEVAVSGAPVITDAPAGNELPLREGSWRQAIETPVHRAVVTTEGGYQALADGTVPTNDVPRAITRSGVMLDDNLDSAEQLAELLLQGHAGGDHYTSTAAVRTWPNRTAQQIDLIADLDLLSQAWVQVTPSGHSTELTQGLAVTSLRHRFDAEQMSAESQFGFEPKGWWTYNITPGELLRWDDGNWDDDNWGY